MSRAQRRDRPDEVRRVGVIVDSYLPLTETFIYDTLVSLRSFHPSIVAREIQNLDSFPLPPTASLTRSHIPRRWTMHWMREVVARSFGVGKPILDHILDQEAVALIHAHFGPVGSEMVAVKERTGLPLVTSFYGYDASRAEILTHFRDRYRKLFDAGDLFLVEGPAMKSRLAALGCPGSKIVVQRIGIDPARYRFRERMGPGGHMITLLQCGRMVPKKGYACTLGALAIARRQDRRLRLRIIGDGPERPAIEEAIRALHLVDAVTLLGSLPRDAFIEELSAADLFIQPSQTAPDGDSEGGAPTTLLEAQAMGVPILSTWHADIPEVVRHGESALLSAEGDIEALADNLTELAKRPQIWRGMGRAGRAWIEQAHGSTVLGEALERHYERLAPME